MLYSEYHKIYKRSEIMNKKMSNEKFRIILLPIIAVVLILAIVLPIAANSYSATLDMTLGRGKRHVVELDDVPKEATQYYDVKFPTLPRK